MALLRSKSSPAVIKDFDYLPAGADYFDSACQTLRPGQVIEAVNEYYLRYNACGERVKYDWGRKVDEKIAAARHNLLELAGKSQREYACAFTLNTTYGINLILSQLPAGVFERVVTSESEHNSVFLPAMAAAKRLGVERIVLDRQPGGALVYKPDQLRKAIVIVNTTSNVDGSNLGNAAQLVSDTHEQGGIVIFDGAQAMGHDPDIIRNIDFDGLCFSGHKMYGPSIGVIIIRKELLERLSPGFVGGGMVSDVQRDGYTLLPDEPASRLEAGLQNFSGIIGLDAAVTWHKHYRPQGQDPKKYERRLAGKLFDGLADIPSVTLLNQSPSPIVSFYSDKIDAHKLAIYLSASDIMVRSGYFCCHYWLDAKRKLPPLLRVSLGLNNTEEQVDELLKTINSIIRSR